jgi:nucleotide-binding universal stress UspA family protein
MSAIRSMLVHVDAAERSGTRLRLALDLAREHGAELTAMYAVSSIAAEYPFAMTGDAAAAAVLLDAEAEIRKRARARFDAIVAGSARPAWCEVDLAPEHALSRQARYADLVVLGQQKPHEEPADGLSRRFAESVLMESGRPGLVVPYIDRPASAPVGKVAVVAWKNTPEAARAVGAALPFLQRAQQVHVVCWDEGDGERADPARAPLDIEHYLALHDVRATLHRRGDAPADVGEALLSFAADVGADLLVMGCYGHGRAREWVLGGATRSILHSMTLPVLFAH